MAAESSMPGSVSMRMRLGEEGCAWVTMKHLTEEEKSI